MNNNEPHMRAISIVDSTVIEPGRNKPMSVNTSTTPSPVFALVSKNNNPFSAAYVSASSVDTAREVSAKSSLLPTRAMTMLGLACLCSSLTQDLALSSEAYTHGSNKDPGKGIQ